MTRSVNRTCRIVVLATLSVSFYTYVRQETEFTSIGSFNLHITDALFGLILFCSLFGLENRRGRSPAEMMLLFLSGLLLLSFSRGVIEAGNAAAGNAFRLYSVFTALIIFMYFWGRKLDYQWVFDKIIWLGWAVVFLGIARIVLGLDAFVRNPDPFEEPRIFNSAAALLLGQAALIALYRSMMQPSARRSWNALCFTIFFATILLSNQRTATFATIAGVIAIVSLAARRRETTIICAGIIACAVGIGILAIASLSDGELTKYLPHSLQMIASQEGSYGWRLDQWQIYFQQWVDATPFDQIVGQPFGIARAVGLKFSTLKQVDPLVLPAHSGYLQFLLNVGVIGLLIFISVLVFAFADAIVVLKGHQSYSPLVVLAVAILVSQVVFSFSYSFEGEQGLPLAISVQIIALAREASARVRLVQPRSVLPVPLYVDRPQSSKQRN